jgi:hypothetical protein
MGSVDIADQLRSYYSTQLTVHRTWPPLFFWLLDTAIINSYIISKKLEIIQDHKSFRLEIIRQLIKDSINNSLKRSTHSDDNNQSEGSFSSSSKKIRVSDSYELPICRLTGGNHYVE